MQQNPTGPRAVTRVGQQVAAMATPASQPMESATSKVLYTPLNQPASSQMSREDVEYIDSFNGALRATAGIFSKPEQGLIDFALDNKGNKLYTFPELKDNDSVDYGMTKLKSLGVALDSAGLFSDPNDLKKFTDYTRMTGDPEFHGTIAGLADQGKQDEAADMILKRLGRPTIAESEKADVKTKALVNSVRQTVGDWNQLNHSQRSGYLASAGMSSFRFQDGSNLQDKQVIPPDQNGQGGLPLGVLAGVAGASRVAIPYLVKNWNQLGGLSKIVNGGVDSPGARGLLAKNLGLSEGGAAVNGLSASQLASSGFVAAPDAGIGAIIGPSSNLPAGYTAVQTSAYGNGTVVAVPEKLAGTASAPSALTTGMGILATAKGAHTIYQGWGTGGKEGALNGAVGGTMMGAGLVALGANPYTAGAVVGLSVLSNTIKMAPDKKDKAQKGMQAGTAIGAVAGTFIPIPGIGTMTGALIGGLVGGAIGSAFGGGKSETQIARDNMRELIQEKGLADDKFNVRLADGTMANIGVDGKGGQHTFRFADKLPKGAENRELNAYDVDYTNDLDFTSNLMTSALTRLAAGGKSDSVDQMGGQLANAALGNVGFGKDMTPENFAKVQANARGMYAQMGIRSKEEGYALANQAFAEGRFNETDVMALHQGMNIAFDDNGFETAQTLMAGRWSGIEAAASTPSAGPFLTANPKRPAKLPPGEKSQEPRFVIDPKEYRDVQTVDFLSQLAKSPEQEQYKDKYMPQSKEDTREMNRRRFSV